MTYSQKYTLAHFMSPIQTGAQFLMSEWPLHVTLADIFAIDRHATGIDLRLATLFSQVEAADTKAINHSMLGVTPVVLLEKTPSLLSLHADIVSLLEENGAIFNRPEFTKTGFLPHSTVRERARLQEGTHISLDSVSLIDMFPGSDWRQRRIVKTFTLKK